MKRIEDIFNSEQFKQALTFIEEDREHTLEQQITLAQIPAWSNHEEKKAERFARIIVSLIENEEELYRIIREKGDEIEWD